MTSESGRAREAWLSGPVPGIDPLLQPVAHALVQARREITSALAEFPDRSLWTRPAGAASVGFHLQHLAGILDRLLTYADGRGLDDAQLRFLENEGTPPGPETTVEHLLSAFDAQVETALDRLRATPSDTLIELRLVGRAGLESTVLGLLVHAAEHTMRHTGQLLVTARVVRAKD
jgi:uncharacterized damage-inducible protein DinB